MKDSSSIHPSGKSNSKIEVLDATLRQRTFGVSFTSYQGVSIAKKLIALSLSYIETRDDIVVDGRSQQSVESADPLINVLRSGKSEPVLFISEIVNSKNQEKYGHYDEPMESIPFKNISLRASCIKKSPSFPDSSAGKTTRENDLKLLKGQVSLLKKGGKNAFFDAEYFFDSFFQDTTHALTVLETAIDAGASKVVLCDSRGTAFPEQVGKAVKLVSTHLSSRPDIIIGVQANNDCGLAVANTLAAVEAGARHVQGTINGLGERAGKADLCQLLPILIHKMGYDALNIDLPKEEQLVGLRVLSEEVAHAIRSLDSQRPFVGSRAFSHTDRSFMSEVLHNPESFEIINPTFVGNRRTLGVDDVSLILSEIWQLGLFIQDKEDIARRVLGKMRELEAMGYRFEDAKASVHLMILETIGYDIRPFQVLRWETNTSRALKNIAEVTGMIEIRIRSGTNGEKSKDVASSARGVGPIHAIDLALKGCLEAEFPELKNIRLLSYSLNIVDSMNGTAAAARARTEFREGDVGSTVGSTSSRDNIPSSWATTAVSDDVLDASIRALVDGYRYKLIFLNKKQRFALPDWKVALSRRYSERY